MALVDVDALRGRREGGVGEGPDGDRHQTRQPRGFPVDRAPASREERVHNRVTAVGDPRTARRARRPEFAVTRDKTPQKVRTDVTFAGNLAYVSIFDAVQVIESAKMTGLLDATKPEALLYDVSGNKARLMGVEYIVDAATWLANNKNQPPQLEGQLFQIVGAPNRYGLPPFFELHVWAWQDNPAATFADWNTKVSCDQP